MDRGDLIARLRRNSGWRNERHECVTDPALLIEAAGALESRPAPTEEQVRAGAVALFNSVRARHGWPPMTWDEMADIDREENSRDARVVLLATDTTPSREPSEERQVASHVDDELTRSFIDGWNARLDHTDFDLALHFWMRDGAGIPAASLPRAQAFTPSRDEEGSVLANWRDEIGHPNNRLLFKRMVEKAGIDLGVDDIASALAKVAALKTSTPETQTVEGGGR